MDLNIAVDKDSYYHKQNMDTLAQHKQASWATDSNIQASLCLSTLLHPDEGIPGLDFEWFCRFPLSLVDSRKVVQNAMTLNKSIVKILVFGNVMLSADAENFFCVLFDFGSAVGVRNVATELYDGACAGDPRAVKMYMEFKRLLARDEAEETELAKNRLVMVNMPGLMGSTEKVVDIDAQRIEAKAKAEAIDAEAKDIDIWA